MSYLFTVSPDFVPDKLYAWYIFNTWLQKQTGEAIHLEMFNHYQNMHQAIKADEVDLIYANPYDAAMLVRELGFLPLVRAEGVSDEVIIAVNANSPYQDVDQLVAGLRVAFTKDPDVKMMGRIILESADLDDSNINLINADNYVLIAKYLLKNEADVGIFLANAYQDLSAMIKKQLRVLVKSQISVIHHGLLVGHRLQHRRSDIQQILLEMHQTDKGKNVLTSLGFSAWQTIEDEEIEFMIDLMSALNT